MLDREFVNLQMQVLCEMLILKKNSKKYKEVTKIIENCRNEVAAENMLRPIKTGAKTIDSILPDKTNITNLVNSL